MSPDKRSASRFARHGAPATLSTALVLRYTLLQIPGWILIALIGFVLREPFDIELWLVWTVVGIWIAKDVMLFPFVWRHYQPDPPSIVHTMIGSRGVVHERLAPTGYVRVRGELWRAEAVGAAHPIEQGTAIRVSGTRGLTLLVEPEPPPRG